jgi:hypothetical protein
MKRLLGICFMVWALFAFSIPSANAQGPWCLTLTGFCDRLQLARDANLNLYGVWDADCDGTFSSVVQGSAISGLNNVVGFVPSVALSGQFYFNVPGRQFDLWAYGGVDPPAQFQDNQAWTVTPGVCPPVVESGLPSSLD